MNIREIDILREKLDLVGPGSPYIWVRWIDDQKLNILAASVKIDGFDKDTQIDIADHLDVRELKLLHNHLQKVNTKAISVDFKLGSKEEGYKKFTCTSKKFESSIESIWILKQDDNHMDLLMAAAHDLKSPINSILGLANIMQMHSKDGKLNDKELNKMLNMIKTSCNQAIDFTSDLLELSTMESSSFDLNTEEVLLEQFVKQYIRTHRLMTLKKQIKITFDSELKGDERLHVNKAKLIRVFDNLMSNAVKFSHKGGTIDFILTGEQHSLNIQIRDHGIGMSKEVINHLFEKFGRSKRTGLGGEKSHGIGLTLVKQIMELHGGLVDIESEEGIGTTAILTFNRE